MKIRILILGLFLFILSGCKKLLNPDPENLKTIEQMYTDAGYAQGFLVNAYRSIPTYYDNSEYATDDAVTNQKDNDYLKMATGTWTAANNPVNLWQTAFGAIQYLNLFLENVDKVKWAEDQEAAQLFNMRMKGEAYGLRALFMYYLLRNHAGFTSDGQLLGVPIVTAFQTIDSDFNQGRATFADCLTQIYSDLDKALENLPYEYNNLSSSTQIPEKFRAVTSNLETYNRVMGEYSRQLFNGLIADAFRSRTALLASSPAFQDAGNSTSWAEAANYAAIIINYKGGADALPSNGMSYYTNQTEIDGLSGGVNPPEIIWRENLSTNNTTQEAQHFPPSLFGTGFMNPSQNLAEAFPMANGYPITDEDSEYEATNPFVGRDPRLARYIIYNGSTAGVENSVIYTGTATGMATGDGINIRETSTRTGYYMKKRLRMDVNVNPSSTTGKTHYNPRIRYTEMYLIYAEAANEAWGPTGNGGNGFSAYDIIKAIRKRAGVGGTNDPYLEKCKADQDKMRELIRNERRLELCFEGFRFWDLRRWKVNLNETAKGIDINGNSIVPINVENRSFQDYMYYGPIPYSEILKYNNIQQNKGWD
ncbi:RagB/SusD family nutrient uptake outer membrane protein [Sphingobacterium alkalisoli]|uniref:RagB/SusD family nutrient uptake outer membrane protein n=1 Tax=Sphingobacterium alkalisoli TaxID=1874115 RepID=A0A4U0H4U5_9SPHI|nr:RagB/SusD family nutrient uptake outer membrane protein [Sphingobacterium alkalisoli]TJY66586.1 RagB/SusD family nutrient uptake outer membrane protein [Sphingobacterium alkalisoli]GGH15491.1 carbohydrate-binding protein [Sphingobacterium alkalisoli]